MTNEVNLDLPEALYHPAEYFAAAREHGDIQWSSHHNAWMVLDHAGVEDGLRDAEHLSSDKSATFARAARGQSEAFGTAVKMLESWMNFRDDPEHDRLRSPVRRAFTPRAVNGLADEVQAIVDVVINEMDPLHADLSHDFARPIPALVIGAVLGVPPADRHRFYGWSHDLGQLTFAIEPGGAPAEDVGSAATEFIAFFNEVIERERRGPSGSLLATIVATAGDMSPLELVGACTILLFAGHETTTTLLVNTLGYLLTHEDALAWLRSHPEAMETAVDEFMRVLGPARVLTRKVAHDHTRGGHELRKGQNVFLCVAAANHDPAVFADPGHLDLTRDPNPHLGFGWGPHYCLGANLARLEAAIALRTLLKRFPTIEPRGEIAPARASALGYGRRPLPARLA